MRTRRLGLLAAVVAAMLVIGACTGDGDIEVLVDDGTDPSVLLGEAIDRTVSQSGRLVQTTVMEPRDPLELEPDSSVIVENLIPGMELRLEGEFDGGDFRVDMTMDAGVGAEQGTYLVVGGELYRTVDESADRLALDALDGRTWIEVTHWAGSSTADPPVSGPDAEGDPLAGIDTPGDVVGALESFRELLDLTELDPGEIDGVEYRRLRGRYDGTSGIPVGAFGATIDEEERARWERIEAYRADRQWIQTEVWIDDAGFVRRLVMDSVDEVEPQYRVCFLLHPSSTRMQLDLFDLGADVDISAPDPSDVMPAEEYEQLTGLDQAMWDELAEWDGEGEPPLPDGYVEDAATTTTALGGEWTDDDPITDGDLRDLEPGSVEWDHDMFEGCPA